MVYSCKSWKRRCLLPSGSLDDFLSSVTAKDDLNTVNFVNKKRRKRSLRDSKQEGGGQFVNSDPDPFRLVCMARTAINRQRKACESRSSVQSLMSTTGEESSLSDLTQIPVKVKTVRNLQRDTASRRHRKKYLKYSTILRNSTNENDNAKICEQTTDTSRADEDCLGEERKNKITRSLESLYACSIVVDDFFKKPCDEDFLGDERKHKITRSLQSLYVAL
eukprot:TRINITY_DN2901_c0_g1_i2.p1 TRINITY_DN2901_c0_g1~~TRINITY_DN2901_c0_g1_i2.p1  ORF type:complete len:220 (-),score=29.59 TRINITY_DN2901_c0_g1_i2:266-925(-)